MVTCCCLACFALPVCFVFVVFASLWSRGLLRSHSLRSAPHARHFPEHLLQSRGKDTHRRRLSRGGATFPSPTSLPCPVLSCPALSDVAVFFCLVSQAWLHTLTLSRSLPPPRSVAACSTSPSCARPCTRTCTSPRYPTLPASAAPPRLVPRFIIAHRARPLTHYRTVFPTP
jgi:hypothetical protein